MIPRLHQGPREPEARPEPRRRLPGESATAETPPTEEPREQTEATDPAFTAALRTFPGWRRLSAREVEVLFRHVVLDEQNAFMADVLCLSVKNVEAHLRNIAMKLEYRSSRTVRHSLLIAYGRALERLVLVEAA